MNFFYVFILILQLITASLSFSSALYSVLTRSSIPEEKRMLVNIEDFVMEHLNLTKTAIFEFKVFLVTI